MIRGMHAMFYSSEAEALRAFLRDTLRRVGLMLTKRKERMMQITLSDDLRGTAARRTGSPLALLFCGCVILGCSRSTEISCDSQSASPITEKTVAPAAAEIASPESSRQSLEVPSIKPDESRPASETDAGKMLARKEAPVVEKQPAPAEIEEPTESMIATEKKLNQRADMAFADTPLEPGLKFFAKILELKVEFDPSANEFKTRKVSVEVLDEVTAGVILDQVLKSLALIYRIKPDGTILIVKPDPAE